MSRRFTAQFNPRISKDSDQIIEPVNDPNAYRKSVREFAARQIQIVRAKQKSSQFLQLNSFGRVEGGMGGFGEPLRNKGYYGTEPPISYSFNVRPNFSPIYNDRFKFRHLGDTNPRVPFSNIPAQKKTTCCPPKNINIR